MGKAIRESGIPREEIFLVTKLPCVSRFYGLVNEIERGSLVFAGITTITRSANLSKSPLGAWIVDISTCT